MLPLNQHTNMEVFQFVNPTIPNSKANSVALLTIEGLLPTDFFFHLLKLINAKSPYPCSNLHV